MWTQSIYSICTVSLETIIINRYGKFLDAYCRRSIFFFFSITPLMGPLFLSSFLRPVWRIPQQVRLLLLPLSPLYHYYTLLHPICLFCLCYLTILPLRRCLLLGSSLTKHIILIFLINDINLSITVWPSGWTSGFAWVLTLCAPG